MRLKRVRISLWFLCNILSEEELSSHFKVIKGLPRDAKFFHVIPQDHMGVIDLVFESAQWEELKIGDPIPLYEIQIELIGEKND